MCGVIFYYRLLYRVWNAASTFFPVYFSLNAFRIFSIFLCLPFDVCSECLVIVATGVIRFDRYDFYAADFLS